MGKLVRSLLLVGIFIFAVAFVANAATLDEAKAMAQNAAAFAKANGKDKAAAEFGNPKGQFTKGELYITFVDFNGVVLMHGANPALAGKNLLESKDPVTGKFFVKEQIEVAKTQGGGWTSYNWTNPATKAMQMKKSWVQKVDGMDAYVVCGIFQ
ncbi:MAG: Cache domain protein [Syntrophus sp. PtaB.Bin001]|nr:MAG: Cache domain protein [Syntrophus sp. PtaB.Bin001]